MLTTRNAHRPSRPRAMSLCIIIIRSGNSKTRLLDVCGADCTGRPTTAVGVKRVLPVAKPLSLQCSICCYRSSARLDLIKHAFSSHSFDPTFHFVCGIHSCLHRFKSGATFRSFKTHAHRKHPHWQEDVNDSGAAVPMNLPEIAYRVIR